MINLGYVALGQGSGSWPIPRARQCCQNHGFQEYSALSLVHHHECCPSTHSRKRSHPSRLPDWRPFEGLSAAFGDRPHQLPLTAWQRLPTDSHYAIGSRERGVPELADVAINRTAIMITFGGNRSSAKPDLGAGTRVERRRTQHSQPDHVLHGCNSPLLAAASGVGCVGPAAATTVAQPPAGHARHCWPGTGTWLHAGGSTRAAISSDGSAGGEQCRKGGRAHYHGLLHVRKLLRRRSGEGFVSGRSGHNTLYPSASPVRDDSPLPGLVFNDRGEAEQGRHAPVTAEGSGSMS